MNRFTSLALAALLTPTLALGTGSLLAQDRDADHDEQTRSTERSGTTSGEDGDETPTHERYSDAKEQADHEDQVRQGDQQDRVAREDQAAQEDQDTHMTGKPEKGFSADDLIGQNVKHRETDQNVGKVKDLLFDQDGKVVAVVLSTGGRLGIGGRNVAVNWNEVERSVDGNETSLFVDMDREALKDAPEYEGD